jgi:hypothetical protein
MMDKLKLTCSCGQDMLVPASAMGRMGWCPQCGEQVRVAPENTRPHTASAELPERPAGSGLLRNRNVFRGQPQPTGPHREDASRRFASAVDMYDAKRYREALAVLDELLSEYPGNPHILAARDECLAKLQGPRALPNPPGVEAGKPPKLDVALVRSVLLDKLLHGDDDVQLRAAELAMRLLKLPESPARPPPFLKDKVAPPAGRVNNGKSKRRARPRKRVPKDAPKEK